MVHYCCKCSEQFSLLEDRIRCGCGCRKQCHLKCAGMNVYDLRLCVKNDNVLWLCDDCLFLFRQQRSTAMHGEKNVESSIENTVEKLQSEIEEMKKGFSELKESMVNNCISDIARPSASTPRANDTHIRMNISSQINNSPSNNSQLFMGCNAMNESSNGSRKFWIFFTRIARHVSCDEIRTMVHQSLKVNDPVDVVKLTPSWMRTEDLRYVSFKVGVDWKHRKEASLKTTWPVGLMFREFVNHESGYWQP